MGLSLLFDRNTVYLSIDFLADEEQLKGEME
jgi:hypothetical protein